LSWQAHYHVHRVLMFVSRGFGIAVAMVAVVAVSQACLIELTATIFRRGWVAPFALAWVGSSLNVFLALPRLLAGRRAGPAAAERVEAGDVTGGEGVDEEAPAAWRSLPRVSAVAELLVYLLFFALAAVANVCYSVALVYMHPAVVAAIFSTAPFFVAVLSLFVLRRTLYVLEIASAAAAMAGIVMVSGPWNAIGAAPPFFAVACAVTSPVAAAVFKVLFSKTFTGAGRDEVGFVLGKVAVVNVVVGGAMLAVVYGAGFAPLPWGPGMEIPWLLVAVKSCGSVAFNFAIGYGVTITLPLFISLGTVISTAIVVVADGVIWDTWPEVVGYAGMGVIGAAFACLVANFWFVELRDTSEAAKSGGEAAMDAALLGEPLNLRSDVGT
jgi:drug/metabolite transporter (DMT)-like permease